MALSSQARGRLAVSTIVAIIGFIPLNRACGVMPDILIWWLFYVVGSGVVLNTQRGETPRALAYLAILPALTPILVAGFFVLAKQPLCVSLPSPLMPILLPIVSWVAIFLFSFAREPLAEFIKLLFQPKTEKRLQRAVTAIQVLISGIAAIVLAMTTLGSQSSSQPNKVDGKHKAPPAIAAPRRKP